MTASSGGRAGGLAIIAAGIFGLGWLAAPDAVERTKTEVEVIKVPVPTVIEKTKIKREPAPSLPASCTDLPKKVQELANLNEQLLGTIAGVPDDISDARQEINRGSVAGTTTAVERINQAKADFASMYQQYMQVKQELKTQQKECADARRDD